MKLFGKSFRRDKSYSFGQQTVVISSRSITVTRCIYVIVVVEAVQGLHMFWSVIFVVCVFGILLEKS